MGDPLKKKMLIYCHPRKMNKWEDHFIFHNDIGLKEYIIHNYGDYNRFDTLDIKEGGTFKANGFVDLTHVPNYDMVILPDCAGDWFNFQNEPDKLMNLIDSFLNQLRLNSTLVLGKFLLDDTEMFKYMLENMLEITYKNNFQINWETFSGIDDVVFITKVGPGSQAVSKDVFDNEKYYSNIPQERNSVRDDIDDWELYFDKFEIKGDASKGNCGYGAFLASAQNLGILNTVHWPGKTRDNDDPVYNDLENIKHLKKLLLGRFQTTNDSAAYTRLQNSYNGFYGNVENWAREKELEWMVTYFQERQEKNNQTICLVVFSAGKPTVYGNTLYAKYDAASQTNYMGCVNVLYIINETAGDVGYHFNTLFPKKNEGTFHRVYSEPSEEEIRFDAINKYINNSLSTDEKNSLQEHGTMDNYIDSLYNNDLQKAQRILENAIRFYKTNWVDDLTPDQKQWLQDNRSQYLELKYIATDPTETEEQKANAETLLRKMLGTDENDDDISEESIPKKQKRAESTLSLSEIFDQKNIGKSIIQKKQPLINDKITEENMKYLVTEINKEHNVSIQYGQKPYFETNNPNIIAFIIDQVVFVQNNGIMYYYDPQSRYNIGDFQTVQIGEERVRKKIEYKKTQNGDQIFTFEGNNDMMCLFFILFVVENRNKEKDEIIDGWKQWDKSDETSFKKTIGYYKLERYSKNPQILDLFFDFPKNVIIFENEEPPRYYIKLVRDYIRYNLSHMIYQLEVSKMMNIVLLNDSNVHSNIFNVKDAVSGEVFDFVVGQPDSIFFNTSKNTTFFIKEDDTTMQTNMNNYFTFQLDGKNTTWRVEKNVEK